MVSIENTPLSKAKIFDKKGYISYGFYSLDGRNFFVRNLVIPEMFFTELENLVVKNKGHDEGIKELYRVGKRFGYRYAMFNRFPRGNINRLTLSTIFNFFVDAGYAKSIILSNVDLISKTFELQTENLVITSKNGMGYVLTVGGVVGLCCQLTSDYFLEGNVKKISNSRYVLTISNPEILKQRSIKYFTENEIPQKINFSSYMQNNFPQETRSEALKSFGELLKEGTLDYKPGIISVKESRERVIIVEISLFFDIEETFDKETVYNAAYLPFHNIGFHYTKYQNPLENLAELFSAFGFGLVEVKEGVANKTTILFNGYPWYPKATEYTSFPILRGAVEGFLNGNSERRYKAKIVSSNMVNNVFDVEIELEAVN